MKETTINLKAHLNSTRWQIVALGFYQKWFKAKLMSDWEEREKSLDTNESIHYAGSI